MVGGSAGRFRLPDMLDRYVTWVAALAVASCSGQLAQSESADPSEDDPSTTESPAEPLECPAEMVAVRNAFCIDRFEASRPDATDILAGKDESRAVSRQGVLPWEVGDDNAAARAACLAAGKDLCSEMQWSLGCEGSAKTVYGYGNDYEPQTCNGVDLFGVGSHKLLPTGTLVDCHSDYGVFDINGNLWEHVLGGTGATVRGGAYDCSDSRRLHRCDYLPISWTPLSLGFRCCLSPKAKGDSG